MNLSFQNKVALVTGAGSGMGLVTARAFAEAGAAVALADVHENAVRSAAEELVVAGHKAIGIRCNVADEAEVAALVAQTVSTFGRLDAAYNNAGVQSPAVETADATGEEFDRVNAINLRGVWNCMKYELRHMREQGSGAIVNCSSIGGLIGLPGPRNVSCNQARSDRTDEECGARICLQRNSHQCGVPWDNQHADGCGHGLRNPTR
jgi:NAD(P)-dependent dehydrogenase (short-subunit alcohol dehydrogenase family)